MCVLIYACTHVRACVCELWRPGDILTISSVLFYFVAVDRACLNVLEQIKQAGVGSH